MIEYPCPKCNEPMASPDSMAGRSETCPACGKVAAIPNVVASRLPGNEKAASQGGQSSAGSAGGGMGVTILTVMGWIFAVVGFFCMVMPLAANLVWPSKLISLAFGLYLFCTGWILIALAEIAFRLPQRPRSKQAEPEVTFANYLKKLEQAAGEDDTMVPPPPPAAR